MRFTRLLSFFLVFWLSACAGGVATAPNRSDCSFFGNCRCQGWYNTCSGHD